MQQNALHNINTTHTHRPASSNAVPRYRSKMHRNTTKQQPPECNRDAAAHASQYYQNSHRQTVKRKTQQKRHSITKNSCQQKRSIAESPHISSRCTATPPNNAHASLSEGATILQQAHHSITTPRRYQQAQAQNRNTAAGAQKKYHQTAYQQKLQLEHGTATLDWMAI